MQGRETAIERQRAAKPARGTQAMHDLAHRARVTARDGGIEIPQLSRELGEKELAQAAQHVGGAGRREARVFVQGRSGCVVVACVVRSVRVAFARDACGRRAFAHEREQRVGRDGFLEHDLETRALQPLALTGAQFRRAQQYRARTRGRIGIGAQRREPRFAVEHRQTQIADHPVESRQPGVLQRRAAVGGFDERVAGWREHFAQIATADRIVIDEKNAGHASPSWLRFGTMVRMGRSGIIRTATVCLAATLLGTSIDAGAAIRVAATAIRSGATHGSDITLTLRAAGEGTALDLRAKQVQIDGWTAPYRSLRFACTLARDAAGQWACDGAVQARRGDARLAGTLALASNADGGWRVALRSGSAHASVVSDTTTPAGFRVQTQALPVAWIEDVLKALLPTYRFGAGTLDTDILVHDDAQALHTDGTWTLSALGVDSDDGEIGAAALDATGTIAAQWRDAGTTVDLSATLARGGVLVSPLYAEVGAKPVALQLALQQHAQGWHVTRWQLDDPDAIVASGSAELGVDGAMGSSTRKRCASRSPVFSIVT
jgi:hypothetical protein